MSGQVVPVDGANALLGETPALLVTATVDTPAGSRLALTIRTASTTLTVFLQGADAKTWAAQLSREAEGMSSTGLAVANGMMPRLPAGR